MRIRIVTHAITQRLHHCEDFSWWPDKSEEVQKASNELYGRLREAGIDVILDDRGLRPGVMFADWELIGVPHRVTIGDRGLKNGEVEYAHRGDLQNENVPVSEIADKLIAKIKVR